MAKENPLNLPVEAMFARTLTPAASRRSANSITEGFPFIASSSRRCSFWRGGSLPVLMAMLISLSLSLRFSARASPRPGVSLRP